MTVFAIDPGPEWSAYVLWDGSRVLEHGKDGNEIVRTMLRMMDENHAVVFERVESYGMPVGREVFETVFWTGILYAAAFSDDRHRMPRKDVKMHLCGQVRAKDSNIRQALIDRFGGKEKAIGKKAKQGPLYGLRADEWQALALAVTFHDQRAGVPAMRGGDTAPTA